MQNAISFGFGLMMMATAILVRVGTGSWYLAGATLLGLCFILAVAGLLSKEISELSKQMDAKGKA